MFKFKCNIIFILIFKIVSQNDIKNALYIQRENNVKAAEQRLMTRVWGKWPLYRVKKPLTNQ